MIYAFKPKKQKRVLKYQTSKILRDMLREVVESGSAYRANIKGVNVSGKTGTAQFAADGKYHKERMALHLRALHLDRYAFLHQYHQDY